MAKMAIVLSLFLSQFALGTPVTGKFFNKVMVVVFENTNYQQAMKQPFFSGLARAGVNFNNLLAAGHPSQPNYIAMASGSTNGVKNDGNFNLDVNHIADLLERGGLTWKVYAEDYPGNCFTGGSSKGYARKHNPFISFKNVQKNPQRCANILNSSAFFQDAKNNNLPNYTFFVPNLKNSGHDTNAAFADNWYRTTFGNLFNDAHFSKETLVITTFDENDGGGTNQVYTNFNGAMVKSNLLVQDKLNFYSLLKMIEDNWSLGTLNKGDLTAPVITSVWR